MQIIEGGVTAAKGFKAAGMAAGIKYKNGKKDMAMVDFRQALRDSRDIYS